MEQIKCDHLLDYYNGLLDEEEKAAFEAHLSECSSCQEEWAEWQELTADLPYLSEEIEPPLGMKQRILANVTAEDSSIEVTSREDRSSVSPMSSYSQSKKPRPWMTGLLAAGLLLSLGTNAYLFAENHKNEQVIEEQMSKTVNTIQMASEQTNSAGVASIVQEEKTMKLVIQTHNMQQVKGTETYQVWLIEGDKKYRAGTFTPDKNGNGAVVYPVKYPGKHKWDAVAISHEPTPNSKQPKGTIVMASNL
jgi:anti-sigma-K factor RskA